MRPWGKRVLGAIAVAGLLAAPAVAPALAAIMALAPGDPAPLMRGKVAGGETFHVDYSASKLTVVNFWATWCAPCREEMPALEAVFEKRAADGLMVVGAVTGNDTETAILEFCSSLGVTYPVLRVPVPVSKMWRGVGVLPITFLVGQDGKIVRRLVGATPEQIDAMVYDIEAYLDGRPLGPVIIPDEPSIATEEDREKAQKNPQD